MTGRGIGLTVTDPSWKGIYKPGALSFIVSGIFVLIGAALLLVIGPWPTSTGALLSFLSGKGVLVPVTIGVFTVAAVLRVPAVLGLFVALKLSEKPLALIATGLFAVGVAFDLSVTATNFFGLVSLAGKYVVTTGAEQAAYLAAGDLASEGTVVGLSIAGLLYAVGTIIFSLSWLRAGFSRVVGYYGLADGILTVIAGSASSPGAPGLGLGFATGVSLFAVWNFLVGFQVYQLGR